MERSVRMSGVLLTGDGIDLAGHRVDHHGVFVRV